MIVTCHCFFHPAKKLRSGAIVRFSDNSSYNLNLVIFWTFLHLESGLPVGGIVFHKHIF